MFESENWYFNSEFLFNFKKLIWLNFWYLDSKYYFGILNLYFSSKIIDWVLRVFSNSVIHNKSLL